MHGGIRNTYWRIITVWFRCREMTVLTQQAASKMSVFGIVDTLIYRFNKKRTENYEEQTGLGNEAS